MRHFKRNNIILVLNCAAALSFYYSKLFAGLSSLKYVHLIK